MKNWTRLTMTAFAAAATLTALALPALAVTLSGSLDNNGYWSPLLHLGSNFASEHIINGDIGTDYLAAYGGEANQLPVDGLAYADIPNATANPLVWTAMDNPDGAGKYWTPGSDNYLKYWHINVFVPGAADREICWKLRHDDEIRIWNNGELVVNRSGWDGNAEVSENGVLHPGINSITIKLHEGGGGDYMGVRVTDRSGNPLTDLSYTLTRSISVILANPLTDSRTFLSSGSFVIMNIVGLDDGDEYQFSNSTNEVDLGSWLTYSAANPPTSGSLTPPTGDGPWDIIFWTRRDGGAPESVKVTMTYSTEAPVARGKTLDFTFDALGTVITPAMIDNGSTYGVSDFYRATVTPSRLFDAGDVTYTVINNAGLSNSVVVAITGVNRANAYVDCVNGDDDNGDGSVETPWKTIAHALSVLGTNLATIVHLAPGTYSEASGETFPIEPGSLILTGAGDAATDVVLDAPAGAAAVVRFDAGDTILGLRNLTVKGGNVGLQLDHCPAGASYDIQGCVFTGAATDGVKIDYAQAPVFTDCIFTNNAQNGILFFETPNLSILRCVLAYNGHNGITSKENGWATSIASTGMHASYCYIASNTRTGVRYDGFSPIGWVLDHCTILANGGDGYGPGDFGYYPWNSVVTNSIVAMNGNRGVYMNQGQINVADSYFFSNAGGSITANTQQYIDDGVADSTVIDLDPVFLPWASRIDGIVYEDSPVIGAAPDGSNIGYYQGAGVPVPVGVDYYVSVDGDDGDNGLTAETAFATFTPFASLTMNPGDSIHVAAGVYTNGVTFSAGGSGAKPLQINFTPGAVYTVADAPAFAFNGAKDIVISGLTVAGGRGIEVKNGSNFAFTNCVFGGCSGNGVSLATVSNVKFADCVVTNNSGRGIDGDLAMGVALFRSVVADNGSSGVQIGRQGTSGIANSNLKAEYCFFGRNGGTGLALGTDSIANWRVNHCTFIANVGVGYGNVDWSPYPQNCSVTNSVFAYNVYGGIFMSDGVIASDSSLYWRNGRAHFTCRGETQMHYVAGDRSGNIVTADPLFCAWNSRNDGGVYIGSPVLGAAADGSNLGCYQGTGIARPVATTYYVAPGGSDDDDGSQAEPFASLAMACASLANPGDTIRVAAGVYNGPTATITVSGSSAAPIRIIGETGAVIKNLGGSALVLNGCADVEVSGLVFESNSHGINLQRAIGCSFIHCTAANCDSGVCTDINSLFLTFEGCTFVDNRSCGALTIGGSDTLFSRCRFEGNALYGLDNEGGSNGGYAPVTLSVIARQCIATDNGTAGFWSGWSGDIRAENCLAADNGNGTQNDNRGGYVFSRSWRPPFGNSARNSIAYNNNGSGFRRGHDDTSDSYIENCCAYGNTVADYDNIADGCFTNSIALDPLFANPAEGNYRLTSASPCVDAGINQTWMVDTTDMGGVNVRIARKVVDMGPNELFTQGLVIFLR